MKTKLFYFFSFAILLLVGTNKMHSQDYFNLKTNLTNFDSAFNTSFDALFDTSVAYDFNTTEETGLGFGLDDTRFNSDITLETQTPEELIRFASAMIALGGGLGFGNDQTLWCLHAAYYLRLNQYKRSALYGVFGLVYDALILDSFKRNILDFQLKFLMFHAITKYYQVNFIYGVLLAYGLGTEKITAGINYDLTRLTLALVMGFNIILSAQFSIMLQTNVLAFQNWVQKNGGLEIKNDTFLGFINKNNLLTLSFIWRLGASRR